VCIIGGGPAGIAIANELIGQDFAVTILESGRQKFFHPNQWLNIAYSKGREYFDPTFTRHRLLGGSTNYWFGLCRPLDRIDFEARDWLPHSGWPFGPEELEPYYQRSTELFELPRPDFKTENYLLPGQEPIRSEKLRTTVFQFSPPTNFRTAYADRIAQAGNCQVILNANVQEILAAEDGARIDRVSVKTFRRNQFTVQARVFILAAGGIENPRLLLVSNRVHRDGLGNQHGLVGRYFNEHPHMFNAEISHPARDIFQGIYAPMDYKNPVSPMPPTSAIGLREEVLREHKLLNACAVLVERPNYKFSPAYNSTAGVGFMRFAEVLSHDRGWHDSLPADLGKMATDPLAVGQILAGQVGHALQKRKGVALRIMMETEPNPESRVVLSHKRDLLGMPKVNIHWQLTERDSRDFNRFKTLLFGELARLGFKIDPIDHQLDDQGWPVGLVAAKHHAGTTRMHTDPKKGVVDANARVHGLENLYIAGNSVFPTSGFSNPTFTIGALSIRLADHLKTVMERRAYPQQ
jgi:choline dehydrogenase-like flavoprotein